MAAYNRPKGGAAVEFTLPLEDETVWTVKPKILIIEDEPNIASFMSTILSANDYAVLRAANGADGLMMASSHCPEVILLDLGLPDMDGKEIIRNIRQWSQMPIIVVSARTQEYDKVEALDLGADDYVDETLRHQRTAGSGADGPAPCQNQQFGRDHGPDGQIHRRAPWWWTLTSVHVYVDGRDAKLTQNEFRIVALLAKHAGRVLTYDMLLKAVWGPNGSSDNQILRVNMANIRRKIEENPGKPQFIFTEMGVGYRMVEGD